MKITFVKKILADGSPCKKCIEVQNRMEIADELKFINEILIADESDSNSKGMRLAKAFNVTRTPFFVVEKDNGEIVLYTIYFKLVKEVFDPLKEN